MSGFTIASARGEAKFDAPALACGLYVVATPIGNLGDVTIRALETLAGVDLIACEDSRISSRLLRRHSIRKPMIPCREHNEEKAMRKILGALDEGKSAALISDAGTPLISDPGYRLVRAAREAGHAVHPVPGACSIIAALSASGLPTDRFAFAGFLPSSRSARRKRLGEWADFPATLAFLESPSRLSASLRDMAEILGEDRGLRICREMTKLHEEIVEGEAGILAAERAERKARGEIVILVSPASASMASEAEADAILSEAMESMSASRAAAFAAKLTGRPKRELYDRAREARGNAASRRKENSRRAKRLVAERGEKAGD